jgi:hypothetical protein
LAQSTRVVVIGNCQAQMIESLIETAGLDVTVERFPPVFEMTEDHRITVTESFNRADVIYLQRVSKDYTLSWLRFDQVKALFPNKVLVWPNIYFSGYTPDVRYIYREHCGKLQGPLDDYHFGRIMTSYVEGVSKEQALSDFLNMTYAEDQNAFENSMSNLIDREVDVDVTISDYLQAEVKRQRCFYTPNHPHNSVLVEMTRRLVELTGLRFDVRLLKGFHYRLDKIDLPAYTQISKQENVD